MESIGLESAKSGVAHSMEEAWTVQRQIAEVGTSGFPVVIRPSFTMGGRVRRWHCLQRRRI